MILRNWYFFLLVVSCVTIIFALVAEYIYGLYPCELCLKQRHQYYFFIIIILVTFYFSYLYKYVTSILIQCGAIYGLYYSIWHIGVENKLLTGPSGCSSGLQMSSNINDLKQQILDKQVISCDEVTWSILGFSAASLNTIVLLFIFVINGLYIYKYYGKK